ncbi:MAG TPA: hypothetical protein V6D09_16280, partial [Leptolyngbyaceae cyanobacterium]
LGLTGFYLAHCSEIPLDERPFLNHLGKCIPPIYLSLHKLLFSHRLTYNTGAVCSKKISQNS